MLPSRDWNGNDPVSSFYNVPVCLSANAAKQNRLALQGLLSLSIILAVRCVNDLEDASPCMVLYAGPGYIVVL